MLYLSQDITALSRYFQKWKQKLNTATTFLFFFTLATERLITITIVIKTIISSCAKQSYPNEKLTGDLLQKPYAQ